MSLSTGGSSLLCEKVLLPLKVPQLSLNRLAYHSSWTKQALHSVYGSSSIRDNTLDPLQYGFHKRAQGDDVLVREIERGLGYIQ
jgi:hypothetical protein